MNEQGALPGRASGGAVVGRLPSHVLVACMPKSGSSFLSNVIAELRGFRRAPLVPAYDRREHELDAACLRKADRFDYVAQHHVRYSRWTADLCRDYALAPVVLVRSLFDVTVSLRDAMRHDGPLWPFFFAEPSHLAMTDEQLEEMIVRMALPWYVNFYMGWRSAPDALIIDYEDLALDPVGTVQSALSFCRIRATEADVRSAVERVRLGKGSRFNVGRTGRGAGLRPELVREILRMLDFYPNAADDPYIRRMRSEGEAILAGRSIQPHIAAAAPRGRPKLFRGRWWRRTAPRVVMRGLAPVVLIAAACAYWVWPRDLIPDSLPYGKADDLVVLIAACCLAGRLTTYKP
jgi:hypothetical protein